MFLGNGVTMFLDVTQCADVLQVLSRKLQQKHKPCCDMFM